MIKIKPLDFIIFLILILFIILMLNLRNFNFKDKINFVNKAAYEYEVCDDKGTCNTLSLEKIIQPREQTFNICNPEGMCEDVPVNRLLLKEGTDKKYCSNAPYLKTDYVDNWWNANGLIDECEMPPESDMQFTFKLHNQTIISYTGTIQISLTLLNYENNYLALQILIAEDNDFDNLPDKWIHCGNVDSIKGKKVKILPCTGTNIKFIKLVNPEWNPTSLFLDRIEVLVAP